MNRSISFCAQPSPAAGTAGLRTGWKAHHFRSSSEIFPFARFAIFWPFSSGMGAPAFTHSVSRAICLSVSFLSFGGILRSSS